MKKCKCMYCEKEFESKRKRSVCDDCRIGRPKKKNPEAAKPKVKKAEPLSVIECARIVDRYNREHGTNYSYGNFPFKK